MAACSILGVALVVPHPAWAGAQQYEELSAAVRSAMTAAATDPAVGEPIWASRRHRIDWLSQMGARLPRRHFPRHEDRRDFLTLVRYEAQRAGLEPELVLGLIHVESAFRRHAVSSAGALGYMQVMPFWTKLLADGDERQLFDMRTNVRYGCLILRHYLDIEKGDLFMALGRYNGSRGRDPYPTAVLAAWNRWRYVAPDGGDARVAEEAGTGGAAAAQGSSVSEGKSNGGRPINDRSGAVRSTDGATAGGGVDSDNSQSDRLPMGEPAR